MNTWMKEITDLVLVILTICQAAHAWTGNNHVTLANTSLQFSKNFQHGIGKHCLLLSPYLNLDSDIFSIESNECDDGKSKTDEVQNEPVIENLEHHQRTIYEELPKRKGCLKRKAITADLIRSNLN